MYRSYKITDFEVGDYLYKFEEDKWVNYGKIVLEEGQNRTLAAPTIVLNRMRSTVAEHRHRAQELRAYFDRQVSDVEIPERNAIAQAEGAGMPIHAWDSPAGRELSERFDTLLDRLFPGGMR